MKLYPTSGDSNSSRTQRELPVASSRSSLRSTGPMGARGSCEGKEDLLHIGAKWQSCSRRQLGQRASATHTAAAQEDEPVAYALRIAELLNREHEGAAISRFVSQQVHHLAGLTQVETVKRLIHQQHWTGRQKPERQQKPSAVSLG